MNRLGIAVVLSLVLLAASTHAFASYPSDRHAAIIREAAADMGFSDDFIKCLISGADSTDWDELNWDPVSGTTTTMKYNSAHHFDRLSPDPTGNDPVRNAMAFKEGHEYLISVKEEIVGELKACHTDYKRYCTALGNALHTLQDFFSHSNFVDLSQQDKNTVMNMLTTSSGKVEISGGQASSNVPSGLKLMYFGGEGGDTYKHDDFNHDAEGRPKFDEAKAAAVKATEEWLINLQVQLFSADGVVDGDRDNFAYKWANLIEYESPWIGEYVPKHTKENYKVSLLDKTPDNLLKAKAADSMAYIKSTSPELVSTLGSEKMNIIIIGVEKGRNLAVGIDFGNDRLVSDDLAPIKEPTLILRTTGCVIDQLYKAEDKKRAFATLFNRELMKVEGVGFINDLKAQAINIAIKDWFKEGGELQPTLAKTKTTKVLVNKKPALKIGEKLTIIPSVTGGVKGCTNSKIASFKPPAKTTYSPTAGVYSQPPSAYQPQSISPVYAQIRIPQIGTRIQVPSIGTSIAVPTIGTSIPGSRTIRSPIQAPIAMGVNRGITVKLGLPVRGIILSTPAFRR